MYGKYPRSAVVAFINPTPGEEDEFNDWFNHTHVPDILGLGVFDRIYRYEAIDEPKARYLAVWESDYVDLKEAMEEVRRATEELRARGRLLPGGETVWAQPFVAVGPAKPQKLNPVTFISISQTSCQNPSREEEFNQWYNDMHLPEFLATGYFHTAYRYRRYDSPQEGEGMFLALYESDVDLSKCAAIFQEIREKYMPIWYEVVSEHVRKVRQQGGQPRPHDLVFESVPGWTGIWRPIWPQVED